MLPLDTFLHVLLLFLFEYQFYEQLLQLLVTVVYTELLETKMKWEEKKIFRLIFGLQVMFVYMYALISM